MNALAGCALVSLLLYMLLHNWTLLLLVVLFISAYLLLVLALAKKAVVTPWRLILSAVWSQPSGPELFGLVRFRTAPAQAYMEEHNKQRQQNEKLTITHMLTKAWAMALAGVLSGKISHGYYVPYPTTDVACLVALDQGKDLGWVTIERANEKSLNQIETECSKRFVSAREGEERQAHKKATALFQLIPSCFGAVLMEIGSWVGVALGMDLAVISVKKHPFGCGIITNVGKNGVDLVWPPFPPLCRIGAIIAISKQLTEAMVVNGSIQAEECLQGCIAFDLRFLTKDQCAKVAQRFKQAIENPKEHLA